MNELKICALNERIQSRITVTKTKNIFTPHKTTPKIALREEEAAQAVMP
jgi:hypothetical protein